MQIQDLNSMKKAEMSPLIHWLAEHKNFIRFFQIEIPQIITENETWESTINNCHTKLSTFLNTKMAKLFPEQPSFNEIAPYIIPSHYLIHVHYAVQYLIFKAKVVSYTKSLAVCNELLNVLEESSKIQTNELLFFDEEGLFHEFLLDPEQIEILNNFDIKIINSISSLTLTFDKNLQSQRSLFLQTVQSLMLFYDKKEEFLPMTPIQESFEQFFFHPNFYFHDEIISTLELKGNSFAVGCIELFNKIVTTFQISDSIEAHIFSFAFYRAMFDEYNWINPEHINSFSSRNFCISKSGIPFDLLPEHSENESFLQIAKKCEILQSAVNEINAFVLYNSPIDILAGVYRALTQLRKYVSDKYGAETSFAFDTTFGLFVFCFLASDVPNFNALFDYLDTFLPETELSGQMQYAKATIIAVRKHLNTITEK